MGYESREAFKNLLFVEFMSFKVFVSLYGVRPSIDGYSQCRGMGEALIGRVRADHLESQEREDYLSSIQMVLDEMEKFEDGRDKAEELHKIKYEEKKKRFQQRRREQLKGRE